MSDAPRRLISSGSTFEAETGHSRAVVLGDGWVLVSGTTGFEYSALGRPIAEWLEVAFDPAGARLLPLDPAIAVDSTRLRGGPHGDLADRILIASARVIGAPLVTCDGRILQYAAAGHVPLPDARA